MFDAGFAEIFLLALIGLIVLGPEKLPAVARTLGGLMRRARSSWYSLRRSIEAELAEADISEPLKKAAKDLEEANQALNRDIMASEKARVETTDKAESQDAKQQPDKSNRELNDD